MEKPDLHKKESKNGNGKNSKILSRRDSILKKGLGLINLSVTIGVFLFCIAELAYLLSILIDIISEIWKDFPMNRPDEKVLNIEETNMHYSTILDSLSQDSTTRDITIVSQEAEQNGNNANVQTQSNEGKDKITSLFIGLALNNLINLILFIEILETFDATVKNLIPKDSENELDKDEKKLANNSWIKVIFLVSIAAVLRKIITLNFQDSFQAVIAPAILVITLTGSYIALSYWFKKTSRS